MVGRVGHSVTKSLEEGNRSITTSLNLLLSHFPISPWGSLTASGKGNVCLWPAPVFSRPFYALDNSSVACFKRVFNLDVVVSVLVKVFNFCLVLFCLNSVGGSKTYCQTYDSIRSVPF